MKKSLIILCLALVMIVGSVCPILAADMIEKTGVVGFEKAGTVLPRWIHQESVVLRVGGEMFRLLASRDKTPFHQVSKMIGQEVTIKGELLTASKKHPMAAIKVVAFESKGAPAVAPVVAPAPTCPTCPACAKSDKTCTACSGTDQTCTDKTACCKDGSCDKCKKGDKACADKAACQKKCSSCAKMCAKAGNKTCCEKNGHYCLKHGKTHCQACCEKLSNPTLGTAK
ncbi:MAG: hypothetical protein WA705_14135 [Candidatus Ozemobacteraceae bacterium]